MFVSQQKITARFGFSIDAMLLWVVLKSIFKNYSPQAQLIRGTQRQFSEEYLFGRRFEI